MRENISEEIDWRPVILLDCQCVVIRGVSVSPWICVGFRVTIFLIHARSSASRTCSVLILIVQNSHLPTLYEILKGKNIMRVTRQLSMC